MRKKLFSLALAATMTFSFSAVAHASSEEPGGTPPLRCYSLNPGGTPPLRVKEVKLSAKTENVKQTLNTTKQSTLVSDPGGTPPLK